MQATEQIFCLIDFFRPPGYTDSMITIEKTVNLKTQYPLNRLGEPGSTVFFDIETTGFSADYQSVYLIGALVPEEEHFRFYQWFADFRQSEADILSAFFSFLCPFSALVHFNGDTFDLPFLNKRAEILGVPSPLEKLESIDIYKQIRPLKQFLGLENLKQKSVERFLGIHREDQYNGGQLIDVYKEQMHTREDTLLSLLLLHNEEDLYGMPALLPILSYGTFFRQDFSLSELRLPQKDSGQLLLILEGEKEMPLPVPVRASADGYAFYAHEHILELSIQPYSGMLKHYYPNYQDYYYLIYEDTAIHKSVGEYVDRQARKKATKDTCYTKKEGSFLPQPVPIWTPEFKLSRKEKTSFFELTPDCFSDEKRLSSYVKAILDTALKDAKRLEAAASNA